MRVAGVGVGGVSYCDETLLGRDVLVRVVGVGVGFAGIELSTGSMGPSAGVGGKGGARSAGIFSFDTSGNAIAPVIIAAAARKRPAIRIIRYVDLLAISSPH